MNVYESIVRPVVGCTFTGLFSLVAWCTLDGIALGAVLGAMFVCALLFIFTAAYDHLQHHKLTAQSVERPAAQPGDKENLALDEPVFDRQPRVAGDEW